MVFKYQNDLSQNIIIKTTLDPRMWFEMKNDSNK